MDTFFQTLRDIQKKERATGTLSEVDEGFYGDASKYLQDLLKIVNDNPLSLEAYQLRDAQRITSEICERREVKIITSAITNVQRSHNLFKGHQKDSQLYDEIPYNTTPEEEQLYREIVDKLISYREGLISNIAPQKKKTNKIGFKPEHDEKALQTDVQDSSEADDIASDNLLDVTEDVTDSVMPDDESISENDSQIDNLLDARPQRLDESQVAMMFGQAPDDVLLDEKNNPVKEKPTSTASFKGPKAPKYDTVSLQNDRDNNEEIPTGNKSDEENIILDKKSDNEETTTPDEASDMKFSSNKPERYSKESLKNKDDSSQKLDDLSNQTGITTPDGNIQTDDSTDLDDKIVGDSLDNEELVEFINVISTDVLDEDEKTYGPFDVQDVALLPKSIVRILKNNDVVHIIK